MNWGYIVCCLDERDPGKLGAVQASRRIFQTEDEANTYRDTIAPSRQPLTVQINTDLLAALKELREFIQWDESGVAMLLRQSTDEVIKKAEGD